MQKYSRRLVWSDEDDSYVATSPEFPLLVGAAETPEEALAELTEAIEMAIEVHKEDGLPLPEPITYQTYSGQFRLRLPKTLHAKLAEQAEMEGVSLNTLAVQYLAEGAERAIKRPHAEQELAQFFDLFATRFHKQPPRAPSQVIQVGRSAGNWAAITRVGDTDLIDLWRGIGSATIKPDWTIWQNYSGASSAIA